MKSLEKERIVKQYKMVLSGDLIAVSWNGELVSPSHSGFLEALSNLIAPDMQVVFNMEKVYFIDSTGIRFLISVKQFVESNGATLTLCNLNRYVDRTLLIAGQEKIFNTFRRIETFFEKQAEVLAVN